MIILTAPANPVMGFLNRTCLACGQPYYGNNYAICPDCENSDEEFLIKDA